MSTANFELTEKEWDAQVKELAKKYFGWSYYHPFLSTWSERGFPDLTLLRPPRLIFAELKTNKRKSKLTWEQARWLWQLRKVPGIEVYVWRPRHLEKIAEILR